MSRRRKTQKRKSSGGRRRMSGIGGSAMQLIVGAAAGSIAAQVIASQFAKTMPGIKDNVMTAGQAGLGVLAALKSKNPLFIGLGLGLVGSAALSAGRSFGLLSGVGNSNANLVTFSARPILNGFENENVLAGCDDDQDDEDAMSGLNILAGTSI